MAAKIRLKRGGRKGQAAYRIVVLDGQRPRDAKVVADLGFYDPKTNPPTFEVDSETALKWLLDGAKATSAARSVLSKAGVMAAWDAAKRGGEIVIEPKELKPSAKRKKKEEPVEEEGKAEEPIEEPAEEPAQAAEDASEPAAEEETSPAPEAEADEAAEDASEGEDEEAAEPEVAAEEAPEEAPEVEEPADEGEEEAKEEA